MRRQKVSGSVVVEFTIGTEGRVVAAGVVESSHPAFNESALTAVRSWMFQPGVRNGVAVNFTARQKIDFEVPKRRPMPPFAEGRKKGSATVAYWLNDDRQLVRTEVLKASSPAHGKAALAALADGWTHDTKAMTGKPGRNEGRFQFTYSAAEMGRYSEEILKQLGNPKTIAAEDDLDKILKVVVEEDAVFPLSLRESHAAGSAVVEFVVDPEGTVQWPRVVEATHEDFGYAAAQAVGQWAYESPRRQGRPVAVRLRRTVEFRREES